MLAKRIMVTTERTLVVVILVNGVNALILAVPAGKWRESGTSTVLTSALGSTIIRGKFREIFFFEKMSRKFSRVVKSILR
jgi:hypothetical protein